MYVWSSSALSAEYGSAGHGYQSCSWSAEQEKLCFFPCPRSRLRILSRETGSAVPPRVSPLILHSPRDLSRLPRRQRPFIYYTVNRAIGPVPSLSGHVVAYRWRSLPRGRRRRPSSLLKLALVTGAAFSGNKYSITVDQMLRAPLFFHTTTQH